MLRFSVLIPCYNSARSLKLALLSCLHQSYPYFEIVVVDDGSQDNIKYTIDCLQPQFAEKNIGIIYHRNRNNAGVAFSRNVAWDLATGDYICFLDADDIWHAAKLRILNAWLQLKKVPVLFHGHTHRREGFFSPVEAKDYTVSPLRMNRLLLGNPGQTSCFTLQRLIGQRFNASMRYSEDYDLWLRISRHHPIHRLEGKPLTMLARRQQTPGGLSARRGRMRMGEIKAYANFVNDRNLQIFFPAFLLFSACKHIRSEVRYLVNSRR